MRLPSDRLRSCLPATLLLAPAGTLAFGWSVQERAGGMALPIVATFFQGIGLMDAFNGLNTYAAGMLISCLSWYGKARFEIFVD